MCEKIYVDKDCNTIIQNEPFEQGFVYVYIFQLNQSNREVQILLREKESDNIKFTIGKDGYYTICRLKVPTDDTQQTYYKNGRFYNDGDEIEIQTLIDLKTVETTYWYYFQLCNLRKCYINVAQQVLNNLDSASGKINCNWKKADSDLLYKRDLIWTALNVIQYMAEMQQFEEASRLLDRIIGCNGLCKDPNNDCGCNGMYM